MATMTDPRWQEWTDKFLALASLPNRQLLTFEQSNILALLTLLESKDSTQTPDLFQGSFMYMVVDARANSLGLKMSAPAIAYIGTLSPTPGIAVMYTHALARHAQREELDTLTLSDLVALFPMGLPTNDELNDLWDEQKQYGQIPDNYLDTVSA